MMINLEKLKELKACNSGVDNFAKYHGNLSFDIADALLLPNVPYSDKKWLISLAVPKETYKTWITGVLSVMRDTYPTTFFDQIELRGCINLVDNFTASPFPEQAEAAFKAAEAIVEHVTAIDSAQWQSMNLFLLTSYL